MAGVPSSAPQTVRYLNFVICASGQNDADTSEAGYIDVRNGVRKIPALDPQTLRRAPN
jgi:hypothetical protein